MKQLNAILVLFFLVGCAAMPPPAPEPEAANLEMPKPPSFWWGDDNDRWQTKKGALPSPTPFELFMSSGILDSCLIQYYPLFKVFDEPWMIEALLKMGESTVDISSSGKTRQEAENNLLQKYEEYKAMWCE